MKHEKHVGMNIGSDVQAHNKFSFDMKRETLYQIQAHAPLTIDQVTSIFKAHKVKNAGRKIKNLMQFAVQRDDLGGLAIPADRIANSFRRISEDLRAAIFSNLIWSDEFHNLVTTVGLNDSLNKHFKASSYTAAWYVGLAASSPTFAAGDTMASHGGWTENTTYSESVRQTLTLGTPSSGSVDNSASKAVFSINGTTTVGGAFVVDNSTKSGTSGTLYGGGAFGGGNRSLQSGDTLSITITLTAS